MSRSLCTLVSSCLLLTLVACTERVEVLTSGTAGGAAPGGDGGAPRVGCGACQALELCAIDRCVDATSTTALGSGLRHACEVSFGALYCWGDNDGAQLGLGDTSDRLSPERLGGFEDWLAVTGGQQQTCAIRSPGTLYCWGENTVGQLGLGDDAPRNRPARMPGYEDYAQVSCGGDTCCALRAAGALYCWGDDIDGNLGQGDARGPTHRSQPVAVAPESRFDAVSVGSGHVCAIGSDGSLHCWGRNTDGQLGIGSRDTQRREPTRVGTYADWRSVSAGQHHTCGVRGVGELYCWGKNDFFELGIGRGSLDDATLYPKPVRVGADEDWSAVSVGGFHSCAIKRSGALYCFGRNTEGQLGLGDVRRAEPASVPTPVAPTQRFRRVTLGSFHSCVLDDARETFCWGGNTEGQLGLGDTTPRNVPAEHPPLP